MTPPTLVTSVRTMFFDTDAAGVVHNIAYLRFIETNRSLLAEKLGWPLAIMLEGSQCPVVIRTEIDYKRPAKLFDELVVTGCLEEFTRTRFWCGFTIRRVDEDELIVTCRQQLVVVALPSMKVQRLPDHWQSEFAALHARAIGPKKEPITDRPSL